jgi:serine/threonine protein kinase
MHILKIMHQDIKPDNIMYSPTFKRLVFIDFGGCLMIEEPLGLKTQAKFFGTTQYCSE